jgi:hypothetical protein
MIILMSLPVEGAPAWLFGAGHDRGDPFWKLPGGQSGGEISNSTLQTCDCALAGQAAPPEAIAKQFAARQKLAVDATMIEPVSVRFSLINGNLQGKYAFLVNSVHN